MVQRIGNKGQAAKMVRRLYGLMTRQLDVVEARHKESFQIGQPLMSAADSEKEARTLGNLTKQLEKMIELEQALHTNPQEAGAHGADTKQLRNDLAQRLAKLGNTCQPKTGAGDST